MCYRIVQESLTNIARHSGAQKVWLDLHINAAGELTLRIADNGRGGMSVEGAGMTGMRERALLVHGTLTVTSEPNEGTEVRLVVPARPGPGRR